MSKWFKNEELDKFIDEKINDDAKKDTGRYPKWSTPAAGDVDKNKIYTIRLLPDKNHNFYKKMHYHMIEDSTGKWHFILCPKTFNFDNYCPICSAVYKLYKGSEGDKLVAKKLKRKEKFVQNILVKEDPRDQDQTDENLRVTGKVLLYEFPSKVEAKIKNQLVDKKNGLGGAIFDPSSEGFDLILKVKTTKPGPDGKKWPNYDDTEFARKPTGISDTEEGVDEIIENTVNLEEYLTSLIKSEDAIIDILKDQMVYDLVEDEVNKKNGVKKETKPEVADSAGSDSADAPEEVQGDDAESDEDFIKQLADL